MGGLPTPKQSAQYNNNTGLDGRPLYLSSCRFSTWGSKRKREVGREVWQIPFQAKIKQHTEAIIK